MHPNKRAAAIALASVCLALILPVWGFLFPEGQGAGVSARLIRGAALAWGQFLALAVIIGMLRLGDECGLKRPRPADGAGALAAFGVFLASGLLAAAASSLAGGTSGQAVNAMAVGGSPRLWPAALAFALGVAYREELIYRACLTAAARQLQAPAWLAIAAPTALFALGHLWQGPWAFLQAALAGLGAALLYAGGRIDLHALAWGHAAYNLVVLFR